MPPPIAAAARCLNSGGLVALPTETVYGLGADALNPRAVARIFEVKQRPFFDPLIVHVADLAAVRALVTDVPLAAIELARRFWPGPLTLVLPKQSIVPDLVTAGLPTVAIRVPAHPLAQELLHAAGCPIAAPSANLFGRISPTTAEHVREQLGSLVDIILDGGPCRVGVESTVLSLVESTPVLLRHGGVPVEALTEVVGPIAQPASVAAGLLTEPPVRPQVSRHAASAPISPAARELILDSSSTPQQPGCYVEGPPAAAHTGNPGPQPAPGMLTQHYAPRTPLRIVSSWRDLPVDPQAGILAFREFDRADEFGAVEILSPTGDLAEAAMNLFAAMRRLDAAGLRTILAERAPNAGLGRAINDRLQRAAAPRSNPPP